MTNPENSTAKNVSVVLGIPVPRPVDLKHPISCDFAVLGNLWKTGKHLGVDFATPIGTNVFCVYNGVVQISGWHRNFGHRVWVLSKHPTLGKFRHLYAHNTVLCYKAGDPILKGERISISGDTGFNIKGANVRPHLHFQTELWPSRQILRPVFI